MNWAVLVKVGEGGAPPNKEDWSRPGRFEDLMPHVQRFRIPYVNAQALIEAVERSGRRLMVGQNYRRTPMALQAKQLLGEERHSIGAFDDGIDHVFGQRRASGHGRAFGGQVQRAAGLAAAQMSVQGLPLRRGELAVAGAALAHGGGGKAQVGFWVKALLGMRRAPPATCINAIAATARFRGFQGRARHAFDVARRSGLGDWIRAESEARS